MERRMIKLDDYKAWCAAQMRSAGAPNGSDEVPKAVTEDYLLEMHGLYNTGVMDGFQDKWWWLVRNCTIGPHGLMMVPWDLPRIFPEDEADLAWRIRARIYPKYLGTDGIIRYEPTWKRGQDPDDFVFSYIELLERELESLGFVYDEESNYGNEPGEIDPNLCYVNANGERRRLVDAPSYGC